MLIRFFKSSFLIQYFVLLMITAAIWVPAFMTPQPVPVEPDFIAPLYQLLYPLFSLHDAIGPATAVAIVFISSLTLTNILIYHDLTPKNNILPAFIFILLMGSNPLTLQAYPLLIAVPLFTWFIHTLFKINDEPEALIGVFNASLILAVISMIYTGALFLFFMIWIFLLVFGTFNGRNLLISLIGMALPYLYLAVYYFWTDRLAEALEAYQWYFRGLLNYDPGQDVFQYFIWGIFFLFMLIPAFYRITGTLSSYNINFRKKMAATAWLLAFSLPLVLLNGPVDYHTLIYLPASIMIAHFYHLYKKAVIHEIITASYLILIFLHLYIR